MKQLFLKKNGRCMIHFNTFFILAFLTIFSIDLQANHTVTLNAEYGTVANVSSTQVALASYDVADGTALTLPDATCTLTDWSFAGWSTSAITSTTVDPTFVATAYTPTADITLYAVYQKAETVEQTISLDGNNIDPCGYGIHTIEVPSLNGSIETGNRFSFKGYYAFTANFMEINNSAEKHYFGNLTPIPGLKSITFTSSQSRYYTLLEIYQEKKYTTWDYSHSGRLIGNLSENTTQTFNFTSGNGEYFYIQPELNDYFGRISSMVITSENDIVTYNSNPAIYIEASFNLEDQATEIALSFLPTISFSEPIAYNAVAITNDASLQAAVALGLITLKTNDTPVPFTATFINNVVTLTPQTAWTASTPYTITLDTEHISNSSNTALCSGPSSLSFETTSSLPRLVAPTNFRTTFLRKNSVRFDWKIATGCTDDYLITIYQGDQLFKTETKLHDSYNFKWVYDLEVDKEYSATIQAIGDGSTTSNSLSQKIYFATNKLHIHDIKATLIHSDRIDVEWETDVNSYSAKFNIHKKGGSWGSWSHFGATGTRFTGLDEETTYVITAEGTGDGKTYVDSEPISIEITTPKDCPIILDAGNGTVSGNTTYTFDGDIGLTPDLTKAVPADNTWLFCGWSRTRCNKQSTKPTLIADDFTPTEGLTLYAVYQYYDNVFRRVNTQDDFTADGAYLFVNEANKQTMNYYSPSYRLGYVDDWGINSSNQQIIVDVTSYSGQRKIWDVVKKYSSDQTLLGYSFHSMNSYYLSYKEYEDTDHTLVTKRNKPEEASTYSMSITDGFLTMQDLSHTETNHYITYFPGSGFSDQSTEGGNITLYKSDKVYAHNIEDFEIITYNNQIDSTLALTSFATSKTLEPLIAPFHAMTAVGWSETELNPEGSTIAPSLCTLPILEAKTIYTVYQNDVNLKYYTTIPNLNLIVDESGDAITRHSTEDYTSIVVNEDKSLNIDNTTHVNSVTINPGATVTGSDYTFTTQWLHMIGQDDHAPALSLKRDRSLETKLDYTMVIPDNSRYHFFSLPYTCNIDDIVIEGGTSANINILEYHPENLANGCSSNWSSLAAGTILQAKKGYSIATDLEAGVRVTFTPTETVFNFTNDHDATKNITLNANKGTAGAEFEGWNLVGSPYLDGLTRSGYHQFSNISLVSQPNFDDQCKTYTQRSVEDITIEAFSAYFVQVDADKSMGFSSGTSRVAASSNWTEDRLKLSLSKSSNSTNTSGLSGLSTPTNQSDPTYIDVQPQYTTDYEIGYDLRKMLGQGTRPQFFSLSGEQGQEQRAFNAIPETSMNHIPLGFYTGTTGSYTITADNANQYNAVHLYLTDCSNQVTTDLMVTPYYFNGTAGELNTTRFILNIVRYDTPTNFDTTNEDNNGLLIYAEDGQLSISHLVNGSTLDVIDATGKLIYSQKATESNVSIKAATGLYIIRVTLANGSFTTYKTLIK